MKLRIRVTRADVRDGAPRNGCFCAIALAVRRAVGDEGAAVHVSHRGVELRVGPGPGRRYVAELPVEARRFMIEFDRLLYHPDADRDRLARPAPFVVELRRPT